MDLSNDSQCSMSSLILEILLSFPALGSTMLDSFFWLVIKKKFRHLLLKTFYHIFINIFSKKIILSKLLYDFEVFFLNVDIFQKKQLLGLWAFEIKYLYWTM